jgi:hypothetical protein
VYVFAEWPDAREVARFRAIRQAFHVEPKPHRVTFLLAGIAVVLLLGALLFGLPRVRLTFDAKRTVFESAGPIR